MRKPSFQKFYGGWSENFRRKLRRKRRKLRGKKRSKK